MTRSLIIANRERPYHKRIRQACTFCRKRKVRCDGGEPCSFCRHLGTEPCVYAIAPPKVKKSKASKAIVITNTLDAPSPSFSSSSYSHSTSSPSSASSSTFSEAQEYSSRRLAGSHWHHHQPSSHHHHPLAFPHLTAEFEPHSSSADLTLTADTEGGDKITIDDGSNYLMASLSYLHGGSSFPSIHSTAAAAWDRSVHQQAYSYPSTTMLHQDSASPFPPSSATASLMTSPTTSLCSLQTTASPQWTNTHHWTSQYLEPVECQSSTSFDSSKQTCSVLATSYTTDALGLSFGEAMTSVAATSANPAIQTVTPRDPYQLTYSSMAQSDLFRRRALVFLSQIDCQ